MSHLNAQVPIWRCIRPTNKQQAPLSSAQVHSPCFIALEQKKAKCNVVGNSNSNHSHRAAQWRGDPGAPLRASLYPYQSTSVLSTYQGAGENFPTSRRADLWSNNVSILSQTYYSQDYYKLDLKQKLIQMSNQSPKLFSFGFSNLGHL